MRNMGLNVVRAAVVLIVAALVWTGPVYARDERSAGNQQDLQRNNAPMAPQQQPLAGILNPDGSLNLKTGARGTFDPAGYRLAPGVDGGPRFVPDEREASGDARWDNQFSSRSTDDVIRAVAVSGTDIYIGGSFFVVGKASVNNVARWDGTRWKPLGEGAANGVDGTVYALHIAGDGVYVGGTFRNAGGKSANSVARFDGQNWHALGTGSANGVSGSGAIVYSIALVDNKVLVGGYFSSAGGVAVSNLAAWNRVQRFWINPGAVKQSRRDDPAYVYAITWDGANSVYIGGKFEIVGTTPAKNIARIDLKANKAFAMSTGADDWVNRIVVFKGDVYAAGFFRFIGSVPAYHIARWDGQNWHALGEGLITDGYPDGFGVRVLGLAGVGNELFVAGYFTRAGGVPVASVARWNGSQWVNLDKGLFGGIAVPLLGDVLAMGGNDNGVVVAGAFNTAGTLKAWQLARWMPGEQAWTDVVDAGIHQGVYEGYVSTIAVDGNNVYLGGGEMVIGGVTALGIAKWDGTSWSILGDARSQGVNGFVNTIVPDGTGRILVGGYFGRAGNVFTNNIARWNGTQWESFGAGVGGSAASQVFAIAVVDSETFYAAGIFPYAHDIVANNIAFWNGAAWKGLSGPVDVGIPNGFLKALAYDGGDLFAAGYFTDAGGYPANSVAKWSGGQWSRLESFGGADGVDGVIEALLVDGDQVYAGGQFSIAGGNPAANIAVWSGKDGWAELGGGVQAPDGDFFVYILSLRKHNGRIHAGGYFGYAGGERIDNVAAWDGSSWSPLGSGTNGPVFAMDALGDSLFFTGAFSRAGGKPSVKFARWE